MPPDQEMSTVTSGKTGMKVKKGAELLVKKRRSQGLVLGGCGPALAQGKYSRRENLFWDLRKGEGIT